MASLASAAALDEVLYESPTRHAFFGTILPAEEMPFYADNYTIPSLILRVALDCPVTAGDEMLDGRGRRYLLADFDHLGFTRSHRIIQLNRELTWSREGTFTDPVTKVKRQGVSVPLGSIWVSIDQLKRESTDSTIRVDQENHRIVTRHPLQLGDKLNNWTVRRVAYALGVTIAEAH